MATAKKTTVSRTTTTRRAPAKKTTARRPASKPVGDIEMPEIDVLDLRSEDADELEPDLVEIFRLDGTPYFIDRNIGAGVALRVLKSIKTEGENAAVATMLTEMLGDEAFDALANFKGITPKHLQQVLVACQKAILGDAASGPKA